jgi:hypothetical protein
VNSGRELKRSLVSIRIDSIRRLETAPSDSNARSAQTYSQRIIDVLCLQAIRSVVAFPLIREGAIHMHYCSSTTSTSISENIYSAGDSLDFPDEVSFICDAEAAYHPLNSDGSSPAVAGEDPSVAEQFWNGFKVETTVH